MNQQEEKKQLKEEKKDYKALEREVEFYREIILDFPNPSNYTGSIFQAYKNFKLFREAYTEAFSMMKTKLSKKEDFSKKDAEFYREILERSLKEEQEEISEILKEISLKEAEFYKELVLLLPSPFDTLDEESEEDRKKKTEEAYKKISQKLKEKK
jgi:hypothetical protein